MHGGKETFNVSALELQLVRIESDKNIKSIALSSNEISAEIVHTFVDSDCHLNIGQFPVSVDVGMDSQQILISILNQFVWHFSTTFSKILNSQLKEIT